MERATVQELATELTDGVMCDGFHGWFFNTEDDPADALAALEAIGASRTADIVRRVFARFPGGMPPADRFQRQAVLGQFFPETTEFDAEDREFFAYPDDVLSLASRYAGANSDEA